MNNRISEIRSIIRALRVSMREAEAVMREQIRRDEDCTFIAEELMKMRVVMSGLARERKSLGDQAPIVVNFLSIPPMHAVPKPSPIFKRKLVARV